MVLGQSPEDLAGLLARFPSRAHVCFTTGEPTLSPLLPWLLRVAADEGYVERALITNGRRLADPAYLDRLLDAGLNLLTVSIHGHDPRAHDRLTRAPGSFAQTLRGMRNASGRVRLNSATVMCRPSLGSLRPLLALLGRLGVEQAVLSVVKPRGRAEKGARALVPSAAQAVEALTAALAALGEAAPPVYLEDLPPCAMVGLPAPCRGVLENNLRYDLLEAEGVPRFEAYDRARTEGGHRAKREACGRCAHDATCPGPWRLYVEIHGWDGLDPIT